MIFCVAYGSDADYELLQAHWPTPAAARCATGTPETIQDLYKILSSYF